MRQWPCHQILAGCDMVMGRALKGPLLVEFSEGSHLQSPTACAGSIIKEFLGTGIEDFLFSHLMAKVTDTLQASSFHFLTHVVQRTVYKCFSELGERAQTRGRCWNALG